MRCKMYGISTHAPAQGATPGQPGSPGRRPEFQPTLPHRERPADKASGGFTVIFQPTLPHRERPLRRTLRSSPPRFQPTLPHRERRGAGLNRQFAVYISTHAPAQGATEEAPARTCPWRDFNPRSRTGSDGKRPGQRPGLADFNPRSRTGSDSHATDFSHAQGISTHAPAQGATRWEPKSQSRRC